MCVLLLNVLVFVLVLSLPSTQAHGHHDCRPPFDTLTENLCVSVFYSPMSWQDAEKWCNGNGTESYLAILGNDRVYNEVQRYLSTKDNVDSLWIGANDVSGTWRWIKNIPMNTNSDRWLPNHPTASSPTIAKCALLQPDHNIGRDYYVDVPCSSKYQGALCFRDYHQHH